MRVWQDLCPHWPLTFPLVCVGGGGPSVPAVACKVRGVVEFVPSGRSAVLLSAVTMGYAVAGFRDAVCTIGVFVCVPQSGLIERVACCITGAGSLFWWQTWVLPQWVVLTRLFSLPRRTLGPVPSRDLAPDLRMCGAGAWQLLARETAATRGVCSISGQLDIVISIAETHLLVVVAAAVAAAVVMVVVVVVVGPVRSREALLALRVHAYMLLRRCPCGDWCYLLLPCGE